MVGYDAWLNRELRIEKKRVEKEVRERQLRDEEDDLSWISGASTCDGWVSDAFITWEPVRKSRPVKYKYEPPVPIKIVNFFEEITPPHIKSIMSYYVEIIP